MRRYFGLKPHFGLERDVMGQGMSTDELVEIIDGSNRTLEEHVRGDKLAKNYLKEVLENRYYKFIKSLDELYSDIGLNRLDYDESTNREMYIRLSEELDRIHLAWNAPRPGAKISQASTELQTAVEEYERILARENAAIRKKYAKSIKQLGAKVVFGHPVEREMINVCNLLPGQRTKFLFMTVYFVDLHKQSFPETDEDNPTYKYLKNAFKDACGMRPGAAGVNKKYIEKSVARGDYAMLAMCGDPVNKESGGKAFLIATLDKQDPKGIYVDLVCNSQLNVDTTSVKKGFIQIKIRTGQLLQLAMLHYANKHLNITHAYNAAADLDLVRFYSRNGWSLRTANCDENDEVSREFNEVVPDKKIQYAEKQEKAGRFTRDREKSWPMKLCSYKFNTLFAELLAHTLEQYSIAMEYGLDLRNPGRQELNPKFSLCSL